MQVEWEHGFMIMSVVSFTVKVFCMGELLKKDAANVWSGTEFGDSTGSFYQKPILIFFWSGPRKGEEKR